MSPVGMIVLLSLALAFPSSANPATVSVSTSATATTSPIPTWLPRSLEPLHYSIRIRPILHEGNFTAPGEVVFTFLSNEPTRRIILNVRDLEIDKSSTKVEEEADTCQSKVGIEIVNQTYNVEFETFEVLVSQRLKTGGVRYRLTLRYVAQIQDNLKGLYRTSYEDENGNKRWIAVTQLGPTNARALFPCMDEPQYKARFALSVAREAPYRSIANMPLRAIEPIVEEPNWVWDHFHTTVPMSTYLVALAVFDYERFGEGSSGLPDSSQITISGENMKTTDVIHGIFKLDEPFSIRNESEVVFGVWAPKCKVSRGAYSARIGPKVLGFFSKFFNLSFPLPKQDMIMVPQFHFSAMENWGLIMYRESALLVDPSKPGSRHLVASTVAHELAHQWFGNLVTMKWWNDIWLNEGFATYMSQVGVSHVEPRWNSEHLFVVDNAKTVMRRDSTAASHPVSQRIRKVSDIDHIFDSISYKKGASIIKMMSDFLGEKAFHKGLNAYLRKYRYKNAAQDDLWNSLTVAAREEGVLFEDESVKQIMDTWTLQTGFPVVNFTRDYATATASASQERFLLRGSARGSEESLWWVPLWVWSPSATHPAVQWLRGERQSTLHGLPAADEWIIVNAKQSGFYRVNYDYRNWELLTSAIGVLPDLARAGLVDDALALADVGSLRYSTPLAIVDRLPKNRASVAWVAAVPWLRRLRHLTYGTPAEANSSFGIWARKTVVSLFGVLPEYRNSSDPVENKFYVRVKEWACEMGVQACLRQTEPIVRQDGPTDRLVMELCSPQERRSNKELLEREFNEKYEKYDYTLFQDVLKCLEDDIASRSLLRRVFEKNSTLHSPSAVFADMIKTPNTNTAAMSFMKEYWIDSNSTTRNNYVLKDEDLLVAARFVRTEEEYSFIERILSGKDGEDVQMALEQGRHNVWWMQTQLEQLLSESISFLGQ